MTATATKPADLQELRVQLRGRLITRTDETFALHREYGESIPTPLSTPLSTMHLYQISGAAARVAEDATPFAFRRGGWNGVIAGIDPDPANLPRINQNIAPVHAAASAHRP